MDKQIEKRISKAVEEAEFAFWEVIAEHFPEATYGDLDALSACLFVQNCRQVTEEWLSVNTNLLPEKE